MIRTIVIPCLSSGLAKIDKIMSMFVLVSWLFGYFESLAFFENGGIKHYTRVVQQDVFSPKSAAILTEEQGQTKHQIDIKDFFNKKRVFVEKLWLFGSFSDGWMTKIMIETNQIDMNVCFFQT